MKDKTYYIKQWLTNGEKIVSHGMSRKEMLENKKMLTNQKAVFEVRSV